MNTAKLPATLVAARPLTPTLLLIRGEGASDHAARRPQPAPASIPQQFVDRGAGAGLGVDLLDDNRAIKARAGAAVGQGLARKRSRHDDRGGRHPAHMDFAGGAVDDLGCRADEGAHREDSALFDDDSLDDLAARADKAIV